ncbi:MAG: DUF4349 domain-containing protein [Tissierellales bacterium]
MFLKNKKRLLNFVLVILLFTLIISGCSSKGVSESKSMESPSISTPPSGSGIQSKYTNDMSDTVKDEGGFNFGEANGEPEQSIENTRTQSSLGRKIIRSANVELETKEFDKTVNIITEKTNFLGGYIEGSSITGGRPVNKEDFRNRVASFKLRIPEESFDKLLLDFNDIGNVINIRRGGDDITSQYFDSEARLKSLTIQEERLLDILRKADKIEDIINLERELSNVRYQIESYTGTLRKWDNLVSYSTIDLIVYEVREISEPDPVTLGDRIVDGFKKSIKVMVNLGKELLVSVAVLLPVLFILAIIGLVAYYIFKKVVKKRVKKIDKDEE